MPDEPIFSSTPVLGLCCRSSVLWTIDPKSQGGGGGARPKAELNRAVWFAIPFDRVEPRGWPCIQRRLHLIPRVY